MILSSELCVEQLLPKDGNALLYKRFLDSTDADSYVIAHRNKESVLTT